MTPQPYHYATFTSSTGLTVKVLLDQQMAIPTGGFGGWDIVQRPKRTSMTRYAGRDPFQMDVPVVFDGVRTQSGQETSISTLVRMSQQPTPLQQPPIIKVSGAVPIRGLQWVIQDFTWDNQSVYWVVQGGVPVRLRQSVVVSLLEFVDDNIATTPATPAISASISAGGSKTKLGSGLNAKQEAQIAYGDSSLYAVLFGANPWMTPDPRMPIPVGKTFVVPPLYTKNPNGFSGSAG